MGTLDLSQYTRIPHVAILDTFSDSEVTLSKEDLEQIVANNNARVADTGDMAFISIGHSEADASELEQPPIVGWMKNFSLGSLGNVNPRPCIYADFLVPPDKVDVVKQFPRRSVELWLQDKLIDGVSLLGTTTPRRDLGLLLSKSNSAKRRFEMTADEAEMTPEELTKLILEVLNASPVGQYVQKQMDQSQAAAGDETANQASTDTPAEPVAKPEEAPPAEPVKNDAMHVPAFGCDESKKNQDPAKPEVVAMEKIEKTDDKVRLERDQLAMTLAKLEAKLGEIEKTGEESKAKLRRTTREGELKQLMFTGYQFDLAEEMEYVDSMNDDQYAKHLSKIKTRYQRNPVGSSPVPSHALSMPENCGDEKAKLELGERAKKYALAHGITNFKLALEKVKAGAA